MMVVILAVAIPAVFGLGWVLRGLKALRDEQAVTHELFKRARMYEGRALSRHGRAGYVEIGKAQACVDAAALVAGMNRD